MISLSQKYGRDVLIFDAGNFPERSHNKAVNILNICNI